MSLRNWIKAFPIPEAATPATSATGERESVPVSQVSQVSQPSGDSAPAWQYSPDDDRRPCRVCRNLAKSGRCLAAGRGELRAAWDYEPVFPDTLQRCLTYLPTAVDPISTPGRERWPWLAEFQAPIRRDR